MRINESAAAKMLNKVITLVRYDKMIFNAHTTNDRLNPSIPFICFSHCSRNVLRVLNNMKINLIFSLSFATRVELGADKDSACACVLLRDNPSINVHKSYSNSLYFSLY